MKIETIKSFEDLQKTNNKCCISSSLNNFLNEHGYSCSVKRIARELGLSARHLNRMISKETGFSTSEFMQRHRFYHVSHFLQQSKVVSLTRVAYQFDYYDQAHFIRDFKRFSGLTPGEYCKNLGKESMAVPEGTAQRDFGVEVYLDK